MQLKFFLKEKIINFSNTDNYQLSLTDLKRDLIKFIFFFAESQSKSLHSLKSPQINLLYWLKTHKEKNFNSYEEHKQSRFR